MYENSRNKEFQFRGSIMDVIKKRTMSGLKEKQKTYIKHALFF
jgi:hypothetical protein